MAKVTIKTGDDGKTSATFKCPGCGFSHNLSIGADGIWTFAGTVDAPTFMPSIKSTHEWDDCSALADNEWGPWTENPHFPGTKSRDAKPEARHKIVHHVEICHSYVTKGKIMFLTDSTHKLKGQTVELPNVD